MYTKRTHGQYSFTGEKDFEIQHSGLDEATEEKEYAMEWHKKHR